MPMEYLKYFKDNLGAFGLLAGVLLVITGGTMSIIGVYVNYIVYDTVRWTSPIAGEELGDAFNDPANNYSANLTNTTANSPIQPNSETVYCNSTALSGSDYNLTDLTGVLFLNSTDCVNDSVTMDYTYAAETSMTTIYDRVANAFLILSVALIVVGASVIFRALYLMKQD